MNRRDFLARAAATGSVLLPSVWAQQSQPDVRRVLVMFKCHFDLGFIDTQAGLMRKYFDEYFPRAIEIAKTVSQSGGDHYVWTTGSWLVYEYLEQAGAAARKQMEQALLDGDIAWHALPFSWQSELLDRSMIAGAIGLSRALDKRFGRQTTGAKMTDVPGHTRGIVSPLAENGITFLDIGVNSASTPPEVPDLFQWKDAAGRSIVVMYHHKAYGGVVRVPGSDLAVAVEVRNDNSGPHTIGEIKTIYAGLRKQFPNAAVQAANLTDIAKAVHPFRNGLPVVTQEIGDTWIYGVPSDPIKVARYREVMRLRTEWIADGDWKAGDAADIKLLRRFSLATEHTWGTDTKTWLDFDHYTPHDLAQMLGNPKYQTVMKSWAEKRDDIAQGVASLPAHLRQQTTERLAQLKPLPPSTANLKAHDPGEQVETAHFIIELDEKTGAIKKLRTKSTGRDWASQDKPLGLFAYQTLSKQDYDQFLSSYVTSKEDWAPKDFGKPNIERFGAVSRTWLPRIVNCWTALEDGSKQRIVAKLNVDDNGPAAGRVGWPATMYLELIFPTAEPVIELNFSWFQKKANRLPEALWLSFWPNAPVAKNWVLDKSGEAVSPFDVVRGGSRHMHAVLSGLRYSDTQGSFTIETLDAPVIALGERSPIYFSREEPDLTKGMHFSLFNNGWGTNYIQWFGEDVQFRFRIHA